MTSVVSAVPAPSKRIVNVGGAGLDVIQAGEGRDLVLFHSLLTDRTVFDQVITTLGHGRRLTLVNLPGFGDSDPAGRAIEDYADRVALLFPALALEPESTDVVGVSFGGFVAIALAARHGHLFSRLALADAAAAFPETAQARLRAMSLVSKLSRSCAPTALTPRIDARNALSMWMFWTTLFLARRMASPS